MIASQTAEEAPNTPTGQGPTGPSIPGRQSITTARAALSQARRYRAEHLVAVAEGLLSPLDVITQAGTENGRPLRRITLRQLLLSQPGWGQRRTDRFLSALAARLGVTSPVEEPTIAWLIDPRAGGRRMLVWLDVTQKKNTVWRGAPLAAHREDSK